ncbi:MAG: NAD(P)-dependent oxidoreductase [Pseudomonadota bacterium]
MSRIVISGATGLVGRFIAERFLQLGDEVVAMGRNEPVEGFFSRPVQWVPGDLDPEKDWTASFEGADYFVHCAFNHVPGKYRGGEGEDPDEFCRLNVDGSLSLFAAAKSAGTKRAVFISSRAVYDGIAAGIQLTEDMAVAPSSLYGQMKHKVENALIKLADKSFCPMSIRATGIYGPGLGHKWETLFEAFRRGEAISPRIGTELHADDLAAAVALLLQVEERTVHSFGSAPVFNASDIILDRHDLLRAYALRNAINAQPSERAEASMLNVMDCSRLKSLGWSPRRKLDLTGF